jgi:hypothetical protein
VRGQRCVRLCELAERLCLLGRALLDRKFIHGKLVKLLLSEQASRCAWGEVKIRHVQTVRASELLLERAQLALVTGAVLLSCASFCVPSAFFLSKSCACANRISLSISARSSAMGAWHAQRERLDAKRARAVCRRGMRRTGVPEPGLGVALLVLAP